MATVYFPDNTVSSWIWNGDIFVDLPPSPRILNLVSTRNITTGLSDPNLYTFILSGLHSEWGGRSKMLSVICRSTVDGSEIRRSPVNMVVYPIIYRVSYIPGGCCLGFLNHQQYHWYLIPCMIHHPIIPTSGHFPLSFLVHHLPEQQRNQRAVKKKQSWQPWNDMKGWKLTKLLDGLIQIDLHHTSRLSRMFPSDSACQLVSLSLSRDQYFPSRCVEANMLRKVLRCTNFDFNPSTFHRVS